MATSGTSSLTATRDIIVRRALRMVGAYTSTDIPRPEQLEDAVFTLNSMIKSWSLEGFLWLRQFVNVTLVAGQASYQLGPASTVPMERPVHVFSCNRKNTSGYEVALTPLTRSDYMALPNKTTTGVPVQFYYDAQTINGTLYVWPTPSVGTTDVLVLDADKQLDIMNDDLNDFDFPPQWLDAITYSLAVRIASEYGLPIGERQLLAQEAGSLLNVAIGDDRDMASIKFEVRT